MVLYPLFGLWEHCLKFISTNSVIISDHSTKITCVTLSVQQSIFFNVWFLVTLCCFFPVYLMLFTHSSKIRSIVCQWSIQSQETLCISSHTRGSSSFCSSLWVYYFLLAYWSLYAYSYHASINGSCCEQIKLVKGYRRGVVVLSHADGVRSCRCVRCLNQPSWGRLWRSWASAHTATSPSFTQIHPLLKHWACLWRGECLPCRWWMLQVTTHIANFPVSSCTCIILLSSPF